MKKEDIEKEIQSRLGEPNDHFFQIWNGGFIRGFLDGSDWRINSVWKHSTVFPDSTRLILAEISISNANTSFTPRYDLTTSGRFSKKIFSNYFVRWAYIDDLIPNKDK